MMGAAPACPRRSAAQLQENMNMGRGPDQSGPASTPGTSVRRRGMLAAVAALAAGGLAQRTTPSVQAGVDGDVVLNASNSATATTTITVPLADFNGNQILFINALPDT